jgi:RNA polymerase sigma factor (sigma-70 family)
MADAPDSFEQLRGCLDRLRRGDPAARSELISRACARLTRLTRKMLKDYPRLARWDETDDVFQNATLRLWNALRDVSPTSLPEFFRLAALNIRRELIDLARSRFGPEGLGANHASWPAGDESGPTPASAGEDTSSPEKLAAWAEFHELIDALPDADREVFDLLWYQGLTQAEAAAVLNVEERTVRRRWRSSRLKARAAMRAVSSWPAEPSGDE